MGGDQHHGSLLIELLGAVLALPGALLAGFGLYLVTLSLVAALPERKRAALPGAPGNRLVVVIPAHNEERLVGRCVRSLLGQDYPRDLYRVVVIADNCSDQTAAMAKAAGAEVLIRRDAMAPGKGRALRWAIDRLLAEPAHFDGLVVVDADSIADEGLLFALEAELRRGSEVVQADYEVLIDDRSTQRSKLVAAAFLLFHRVRFSGRARLGMSANLVGNGMLFSRHVLQAHPWNAFTAVEDLENSIDLRLAGVQICFAPDAQVTGPAATTQSGERRQRLRWEGGRFHVVRTRLGEIVWAAIARREARLLDAALDLATPPLGLLAIAMGAGCFVTGAAVMARLAPAWALLPWSAGVASIAIFVVLGLVSAQAPRSVWAALAGAPVYIVWKVATYSFLARGFDPNHWGDSDRAVSSTPRVNIAGVPIDSVDLANAVSRLRDALGSGRMLQVSTVNLDFLVRAQRDPEVMRIFRRTDLNLADGAPVVWLSRLLGTALPGRVAGADLIPELLRELSSSGARVFLLGGENGVAEMAAERIAQLYPGVVVAGTYEPPRTSIAEMDNADILRRITESQAQVLLVALGHPKQERWIDMHREQLPVSAAIGVGCVLDLIAGRSERAPKWMQAVGLEWFYRMVSEPRRLVGRYVLDAAWLVPITALVLRSRFARRGVVQPA